MYFEEIPPAARSDKGDEYGDGASHAGLYWCPPTLQACPRTLVEEVLPHSHSNADGPNRCKLPYAETLSERLGRVFFIFWIPSDFFLVKAAKNEKMNQFVDLPLSFVPVDHLSVCGMFVLILLTHSFQYPRWGKEYPFNQHIGFPTLFTAFNLVHAPHPRLLIILV